MDIYSFNKVRSDWTWINGLTSAPMSTAADYRASFQNSYTQEGINPDKLQNLHSANTINHESS